MKIGRDVKFDAYYHIKMSLIKKSKWRPNFKMAAIIGNRSSHRRYKHENWQGCEVRCTLSDRGVSYDKKSEWRSYFKMAAIIGT